MAKAGLMAVALRADTMVKGMVGIHTRNWRPTLLPKRCAMLKSIIYCCYVSLMGKRVKIDQAL